MSSRKDALALMLAAGLLLPGGESLSDDFFGVAGFVRPSVKTSFPGKTRHDLEANSDLRHMQEIDTDKDGATELFLPDRTVVDVGPDSSIVLSSFYYDPDSGTGRASIDEIMGWIRFSGGELSKTSGVTLSTLIGKFEPRGALVIVEGRGATGDSIACLLFGESLVGTHLRTGATRRITKTNRCLRVTPRGTVEEFGPIGRDRLELMIARVEGPSQLDPRVREAPAATGVPTGETGEAADGTRDRDAGRRYRPKLTFPSPTVLLSRSEDLFAWDDIQRDELQNVDEACNRESDVYAADVFLRQTP